MRCTPPASGSRSRATARCRRIPGSTGCASAPRRAARSSSARGDELKLVWPQPGTDLDALERWDFAPSAGPAARHRRRREATPRARRRRSRWCMDRPQWRLSLQTHKRARACAEPRQRFFVRVRPPQLLDAVPLPLRQQLGWKSRQEQVASRGVESAREVLLAVRHQAVAQLAHAIDRDVAEAAARREHRVAPILPAVWQKPNCAATVAKLE